MQLSSETIGAISSAIGLSIVFVMLRRFKKLLHVPKSTKDFKRLKKEYEIFRKFSSWLFLIFSVPIGLGIWKSFMFLAELKASRLGVIELLIYQPSITLALPSMFLAMFFSAIPIHYIYLRLLGFERYAEYREYENQKIGWNSQPSHRDG